MVDFVRAPGSLLHQAKRQLQAGVDAGGEEGCQYRESARRSGSRGKYLQVSTAQEWYVQACTKFWQGRFIC